MSVAEGVKQAMRRGNDGEVVVAVVVVVAIMFNVMVSTVMFIGNRTSSSVCCFGFPGADKISWPGNFV